MDRSWRLVRCLFAVGHALSRLQQRGGLREQERIDRSRADACGWVGRPHSRPSRDKSGRSYLRICAAGKDIDRWTACRTGRDADRRSSDCNGGLGEKRRRIIRLGRVPSHPREANNLRAVLLPESSRPSAADHPWPPAMRNPVHGGASDAPEPPWRVQDESWAAFHAPGAILAINR
jgi:hypothetical protein